MNVVETTVKTERFHDELSWLLMNVEDNVSSVFALAVDDGVLYGLVTDGVGLYRVVLGAANVERRPPHRLSWPAAHVLLHLGEVKSGDASVKWSEENRLSVETPVGAFQADAAPSPLMEQLLEIASTAPEQSTEHSAELLRRWAREAKRQKCVSVGLFDNPPLYVAVDRLPKPLPKRGVVRVSAISRGPIAAFSYDSRQWWVAGLEVTSQKGVYNVSSS